MERLKRWLPWVVAAALLAVLFARVPLDALRGALAHGSYWTLALYVLFEILAGLAPDAWAAREGLAAAGVRRTFRELLLARGATYLLGIVSYLVGQGGLGLWLARRGVRTAHATGAVLLLMIANGIVLLLLAGLGLLVSPPDQYRGPLAVVLGAGLAGTVVYLAAIASRQRPAWLQRWTALDPLFEAGLAGHLRAVAARVPHMLVLAVLHWGAFRVWGIAVPPAPGISLMPVVLLIAALPVTPGGLGSTQALQVLFFSPWAAGAAPEARAADVLAFSLVHHGLSLLAMALVGAVCLALLRRMPEEEEA